jgi:hypothetical protein
LHLEPIAQIAFAPAVFGAAANKGQMIASVSAKSPACGAFGRGRAQHCRAQRHEGAPQGLARDGAACKLLTLLTGRQPAAA